MQNLENYNDSNFSVFHINIRSLNKHHKELVTDLSLLNFKFDCICLTEIWNYNLKFCKNIFSNYVSHFEPPNGNTKIDGAGIFIKHDLKISQRTQYFNIESSESLKVENLWYKIKKDKQKYIVGVIYRHTKTCIDEFNEKLESTLTKIPSDNKITDCIITGDINVDLICYDSDNKTEEYLNTMLRNAFMPSIILPTRLSSKACTLLDQYFITQRPLEINYFLVTCMSILLSI